MAMYGISSLMKSQLYGPGMLRPLFLLTKPRTTLAPIFHHLIAPFCNRFGSLTMLASRIECRIGAITPPGGTYNIISRVKLAREYIVHIKLTALLRESLDIGLNLIINHTTLVGGVSAHIVPFSQIIDRPLLLINRQESYLIVSPRRPFSFYCRIICNPPQVRMQI